MTQLMSGSPRILSIWWQLANIMTAVNVVISLLVIVVTLSFCQMSWPICFFHNAGLWHFVSLMGHSTGTMGVTFLYVSVCVMLFWVVLSQYWELNSSQTIACTKIYTDFTGNLLDGW